DLIVTGVQTCALPIFTAISFKKPTPEELAHDFLWRIDRAVPPIGMIAVFNRSHYEDVLVARVHNLVETDRIEARYRQINDFERQIGRASCRERGVDRG